MNTILTPLELNELPKHSNWPKRLLGLEPFDPKRKTKEEIDREYNTDKWGYLLSALKSDSEEWDLDRADSFFSGDTSVPISIGDTLYLAHPRVGRDRFIREVLSRLTPFLPTHSLVELGAGYGSVLLRIAMSPEFRNATIFGAEYTENGVAAMRELVKSHKLQATVGKCDFTARQMTTMRIPAGSLVYTCMAVPCVPQLPRYFVDNILDLSPSMVVHFEPCIDHYDDSILGLFRQRYIKLNDYNTNLRRLLADREEEGEITIMFEEKTFFGENPLLPCSFIAWKPNRP